MAQQGRVVGNDDVQDEIGSRVGRRLKGETRGCLNGLITQLKYHSDPNSLPLVMDVGRCEMQSWLWKELHDLFETDDGSLPEVHINYVDTSATVAAYKLLRRYASQVVTEEPYFWSKTHDAERALDSVPNAAALVVAGEAEPFHVVFGGIRVRGTSIPDIGVFLCPDQIALDYRMGSAWGSKQLEALFELLVELASLDSESSVSLEENAFPEVLDRFQKAWHRWVLERAAADADH